MKNIHWTDVMCYVRVEDGPHVWAGDVELGLLLDHVSAEEAEQLTAALHDEVRGANGLLPHQIGAWLAGEGLDEGMLAFRTTVGKVYGRRRWLALPVAGFTPPISLYGQAGGRFIGAQVHAPTHAGLTLDEPEKKVRLVEARVRRKDIYRSPEKVCIGEWRF